MKKILFFCSIVVLTGAAFSGCYYDNYAELHPNITVCDTTHVMSFANDIQPILSNSCSVVACHGPATSGGGYDLSSYAGVNQAVTDGKLYSSVIWDGNASNMPKDSPSKISICDQTKIKKWIDAGAPNN